MLLAPNQRRLRQWNKGRCWSRWPTTKHTLSTRYLDLKIDVKRKLFSQVNKWIKKHTVSLRFTQTNLPHLNNWCRIFSTVGLGLLTIGKNVKISQNYHTHQPEHQEKTQHQTSSKHPYSPFIPILFVYLSCPEKYATHHEPTTAGRPVLSAFSKVCVWPTPDKLSPTFQPRSSRKVLSFSKTSTFLKTGEKCGVEHGDTHYFSPTKTRMCVYTYIRLQLNCK